MSMLDTIHRGFNAHIGIEVLKAAPRRVVGRLQADGDHLTANRRVHGGVIMALADAIAAHGAVLNLPAGTTTATIESKTNFLRGTSVGPLFAEAIPLHLGRMTMVWQTTVRDAEERDVAVVTQTQIVLPVSGEGASENEEEPPSPDIHMEVRQTGANGERNDAAPPATTVDKRRAQILDAAFHVISEKGFGNASMREIAKAARMPIATMYKYVRNKDDILASLFDNYIHSIEASIGSSAAREKSAGARLCAATRANLAEFDRYQAQIRLMNRETRSLRPEARQRVKAHMLQYIHQFQDIITDGIESGEFRAVDAELVANFIPVLCDVWPLRQWSIGRHGLEAVQSAIVDLLMNGLLQRREQKQ